MGITAYHAYTSPVADGTATSVVRPSDWNSSHIVSFDGLAGTAFAGTNISGTVDTAGISLSVGNYLTTAAQSNHSHNFATTTTTGASIIVGTTNSNGVTIGVPSYLTTAQPVGAYLTTARASNDAIGLNTALTANGLSVTANSSGLSINVPAWLTTAAQSNHSHGNPTLNLTNITGTTASASNGLTLSLSGVAAQTTQTQPAGNIAGVGTTFNGTNVSGSMTLNTNGLRLDLSAGAGGAGDGVNIIAAGGSTAATTGTIVLSNSNGVSFGLNGATVTASHNGLTTAAQSNHSHDFATTTTGGASIVVGTKNSSGVTIGVPAYLTTARASNDAVGLNTAQTNVTWTVNSGGISLNAGGYAGTGTTFNGTNASASMTQNSNGLRLDLSVAAGGGGTQSIYAASNTTQSTSGTYTNALSFAGAGVASVGVTNGSVVISVPAGGGGGLSVGVSTDGGTSGSTGTVSNQMVFVGTNGIGLSQSTNGQSATLSIMNQPMGDFLPYIGRVVAVQQVGQNTIQVQPMGDVPYITFDRLAYGVQQSNATNSTGTISCTVQMGIYTKNGSTLSRLTSHSGSFSIHANGTASSTVNQGLRYATMTLNGAGSMYGDVWMAFISSTATAGVNASLSNIVVSAINSTWSGYIGVGSAATNQSVMGMGIYTATSAALPTSMALSHINGNSSAFQRPQLFMLSNGAFV